MAKQLDLLSQGQVISTPLHLEMQQSYLEYAMSVIVGRALPDVRDGLKPVHRRILYAMHELGLTPDRPYRKCARVVGDVLGKYHPHGDQAVYDALVRLVQTFSSRYPLLAGHGNFGSVDDDPPAAMRYTETRLAPIAHQTLLGDVGESTVDFVPNFDNSQQEPLVLPAQLPILLLNGSSGIAVGMATNIPPHNLGEVVDGLIALIDRPDLTLGELLLHLPGPDFPTGGIITNAEDIHQAYATGRGGITLRGVVHIEDIQPGRGRHWRQALIVTELPYQVNKAAWIEKIAALVNQGRIDGVADLRDESDRDGMRVVIELKRDAQPQPLLEQLYRLTALQTNFGVNVLALVDNQPQQLSIKQVLEEFLTFREETLSRRYRHELTQAQERAHVVEGLLQGLGNVDRLIEILRQSADGATAKHTLIQEFNLSDRQGAALLALPLRQLTHLEQERLNQEYQELRERIQALETLLSSRKERLKALKKELRELKRRHGDPRRTRILGVGEETEAEMPMDNEDADLGIELSSPEARSVWLEINNKGYGRCVSGPATARSLAPLGEWQPLASEYVVWQQGASQSDRLWVFSDGGKVYPLPLDRLPYGSRRDRGLPLPTLLSDSAQADPLIDYYLPPPESIAPKSLDEVLMVLLTHQGRIKGIPAAELEDISGRGLQLTKLKPGDRLGWVIPLLPEQHLVIATSRGRLLHLLPEKIPQTGRLNQGQVALRLGRAETIVGAIALESMDNLLLITALGYGKNLPLPLVPLMDLGHVGLMAMPLRTKKDALVALIPPLDSLTLVTNQERSYRLQPSKIVIQNKDGSGEAIAPLDPQERVLQIQPQ
ncbi:DNA topoisomerase 4 subunit A [Candidatus Synechococcus calcipolaris G9]|uniref:DNA topoisomerase (ATP-hydrolyzing) n=1 Tax=Candidatus Synechococcus calcipolaris G9 TaxID=1497997 RepID=A0ABT6EXQ2_9SYNE|nr:DNA topoisomerase (ATP-hydrolyzing) [Candidatus Synechococcus calcipolaris]MDG2990021.1 DNA topoisomerase 4 subunit A [Candidatus Synechococcus calcipolaris G9]